MKSIRSTLVLVLVLPFSLLSASPSQGFAPALLKAELSRTEVLPGDEVVITLTMANLGKTGSIFPLRAFVEGEFAGEKGGPKMVGYGEPFPPTTLWTQNQTVTFGLALSVPGNIAPGEYNLIVLLRSREGGGVVAMTVEKKSKDVVPLGRLTVLPREAIVPAPKPAAFHFGKAPPVPAPVGKKDIPDTILLSNENTALILDATRPVISQAGRVKGALGATPPTGQPVFTLFRKSDKQWFSSASSSALEVRYQTQKDAARVVYQAALLCDGVPAVECDLSFTLAGDELRVAFENVRSQADFILTHISWPRLLAGAAPDARLVNGRFSGRLLDPSRAATGLVFHESTWIDPFVGGVIYTTEVLATLRIDFPGDSVTSSVIHGKNGSVGFGLEFVSVIAAPGVDPSRWIPAAGSSMARLRLVERAKGRAPFTWVDGAKLLRESVRDIKPPAIYQDSVIYKILMDSKDYRGVPPEQPATSFAEAREIMRQIETLGDGIKQVVYLTGAQHEGQDTKYPDVFTTNSKLGTTDDLISLIHDGRRHNSVVSFHSCATEAYKDSPMWNEDYIALNPGGDLFVYNRFAGGDCYWINQDRFAERWLADFLNRIFSTYPITETYHIDVLSTRAANVDFNPARPCSPNSGYAGRLRMVDGFNSHGIDLTSEGFISWFVGKIGHAWLIKCELITTLPGEEPVPFVPMIYHGHATYGLPSELNPLLGILYGATFSMDFMPLERMPFLWPGNTLSDSLYLQNFPFQMLRDREMQNYSRQGNVRRVTYSPDTYVEIDVSDEALKPYRGYREDDMGRFQIVIDGRTVAQDFTAFFPGRKTGTYLGYSKFGGRIQYDAPAGWEAGRELKMEPLGATPTSAQAVLKDGKIDLDLPAGVPVRISLAD